MTDAPSILFFSRSAESAPSSLIERATGAVTPLCPEHRAAFVERGLAGSDEARDGLRSEALACAHCVSLDPGAEALEAGAAFAKG